MSTPTKPLAAVPKPVAPSPLRKPMARAARVTLFEREVRERLSQAALEILLDGAERLSEGQRARSLRGDESYYGSTMLTIDLSRASERVRESCDASAARRIAGMLTGDARVGRRLRAIAEEEAARIAGAPVDADSTDVRVRTQGATILVDIDVEGSLRPTRG